ncbi:Inactivated Zn-dependent protease component of TldD/TldE system [Methanonatronarchaeum thermophilum]|uniref:Inactivated Zn-dependent protease component of TldD/TldE system n=1 Tax=Methanonatronarchaeum thermophilum TaxID=1927129 RepID=A0A1Y3GII3_9EURY|nr:TldD/PmbA family protein [Methanonatronarchaeum thermophilum]OUJ19245.1 Inactivated Zn-dependent protease component of TldD/TldE system [Methanonatronarchaeum thermophilum]
MIELEKILETCLERGASQAEVYVKDEESLNIEIEKQEIKYVKSDDHWGLGIRVLKDKSPGFSSTTDPDKISERIDDALKHAGVSKKTLGSLATSGKTPKVNGVYDSEVANATYDDLLPKTKLLIESANKGQARSTSGSVKTSKAKTQIKNTYGVDVETTTTLMQASISTIAGAGENASTSYEFQYSRKNDLDYQWIGSQAAEIAVKSMSGETTSPGKRELVLEPIALTSLLNSTLVPSLNALEIQRGRSKAQQYMNKEIAPDILEITDDGTLDGGLNSRPTDDEGTPSKKHKIIENGVLKGAFYNLKAGYKEGCNSTSNGVRPSYGSLPQISPRNLVINPKTDKQNLLTNGTIVIRSVLGAHTANQISGDFSVGTNEAFEIKNGELQPLSELMVSGNIFELLNDILEIGNDVRKIGNIVTPSIKTKSRIST